MTLVPSLFLLLGCPATPDSSSDSAPVTDSTASDSADSQVGDSGDTGSASTVYDFVGGPSDAAGNAVALPGDLDGDGVPDVVVAAYYGNRVCAYSGALLLAGDERRTLDTAELCWKGAGSYDFSGYDIHGAGDVDGDGREDLIVGAIGDGTNGSNAGRAWILPGADLSGPAEIQFADAATGSLLGEYSSDYAGVAVTGGMDLTGDGVDDYIVGASGNDAGGAGGGKAYLCPGPIVGEQELSSCTTQFLGLPITPPATPPPPHGGYGGGDAVGNAVTMPGDIDGDGIPDIALGASGADEQGPSTGKVVVYYGPVSDEQHYITDADLSLIGPQQYSYAGSPVLAPGDVDADGYADLFISADGLNNGTLILVHGGVAGPPNESRSLGDELTAFTGEATDDQAGYAATAGDIDGDGHIDVIIGAPANDRAGDSSGTAYIEFGPFGDGSQSLADAARILTGEQVADAYGHAMASGSDVDGDGRDNLLVGAIYNDDGGAFSGKAYLY